MRYRHKRMVIRGVIFIVFLSVMFGIWYSMGPQQVPEEDEPTEVPVTEEGKLMPLVDPLSVDGFTEVDVSVSSGKIVLSTNCTAIAMTTTVEKTYSIQRGIEDVVEVRPNEHDMLSEIIDHFGINVALVKIERMENEVYYADLFLRDNDRVLNVDAKPSDALALAKRVGAKVYVKDRILEQHGQETC